MTFPQPKTVRVHPNPYKALDHLGRPCGVVLCDPVDHIKTGVLDPKTGRYASEDPKFPMHDPRRWGNPRQFVGATVHARLLRKGLDKQPHTHKHDRHWHFAKDPVVVPLTPYYAKHVMAGDLFAADVASWKLLGGDPKNFRDPKDLLAESKAAAIEHHDREHGDHVPVPSTTLSHELGGRCFCEPEPKAEEPPKPATPAHSPRTRRGGAEEA